MTFLGFFIEMGNATTEHVIETGMQSGVSATASEHVRHVPTIRVDHAPESMALQAWLSGAAPSRPSRKTHRPFATIEHALCVAINVPAIKLHSEWLNRT